MKPKKPAQANMFQSAEDLPLFSNSPVKVATESYKPRSVTKQPKLPTLCPVCLNTGFIDGKKCVCKEESHD
jgi:hypothetical protein